MKPEEANELFGEDTLQSMQTLGEQQNAATNNPHSCPVHDCPQNACLPGQYAQCVQSVPTCPVQVGCNQCGCGLAVNHGCQLPFSACPQGNCTHHGCTNNGVVNCQPIESACSEHHCTNHGCPTRPVDPGPPTPTPYPTPTPSS